MNTVVKRCFEDCTMFFFFFEKPSFIHFLHNFYSFIGFFNYYFELLFSFNLSVLI